MKNSSIVSALIGSAFFAVPYLGMSAGIVPSLVIGACAYGAGELIFHSTESKKLKDTNISLYNQLQDAKVNSQKIKSMANVIDDVEVKNAIKEIGQTTDKIISTIEKEPNKAKNMDNFFDYYLPVTLKILNKYDEIENQDLSSEDSKQFMQKTKEMILKLNQSFKNQLSNMYQSDIVDTNAEMKVIDSMLKADGYDEDDFKKKGDE